MQMLSSSTVPFTAASVATVPSKKVSAESGISFCTMQNARPSRLQPIYTQ